VKCEFEKLLFGHSYLNMIYEKDFINKTNDFQLVFRYEFPFAQTSTSVRRDNNTRALFSQPMEAWLVDGRTNYLWLQDNQPSVGKGGIVIVPFLDLNCNGRRDEGEPKAFGLNFSTNGGRIERNNRIPPYAYSI